MATKQIETNILSEDDKEIVYEVITKVISDDGREDIYRDTYVESKTTEDSYKTEHESYHDSGLYNHDFLGDDSNTHIHERPDGSVDIFDESKDKKYRDREPYESEM